MRNEKGSVRAGASALIVAMSAAWAVVPAPTAADTPEICYGVLVDCMSTNVVVRWQLNEEKGGGYCGEDARGFYCYVEAFADIHIRNWITPGTFTAALAVTAGGDELVCDRAAGPELIFSPILQWTISLDCEGPVHLDGFCLLIAADLTVSLPPATMHDQSAFLGC